MSRREAGNQLDKYLNCTVAMFVLVLACEAAVGQPPEMAPVNPEFIDWQIEAEAFGIEAFDEEEYVRAQLGGSLGVSKLNKFCYLHDPLAAWVLLNWGAACRFLRGAEIRVDMGRGDSRGRIIHCASKLGSAGPVRPIALGTRVKWLNLPGRRAASASKFRTDFVETIVGLLSLPKLPAEVPHSPSDTKEAR